MPKHKRCIRCGCKLNSLNRHNTCAPCDKAMVWEEIDSSVERDQIALEVERLTEEMQWEQ